MTKLIPILSGRCLVVELPDRAKQPKITQPFGIYLTFVDGFGFNRVKLPPGNWRIIGMLSEVREGQAALVVPIHRQSIIGDVYKNFKTDKWDAFDALESLESAILAAGWYLENPYGLEPKRHIEAGMSKRGSWIMGDNPAWGKWQSAQSRVLDRSRCLLLGRAEK